MTPVFQGRDLCDMETQRGRMFAFVFPDELWNFFGCYPCKMDLWSPFPGGDLRGINGIACVVPDDLWKFFGSNPCKFCGPLFQRGDLCAINGNTTLSHVFLVVPERNSICFDYN